jgi:hypothetical protein
MRQGMRVMGVMGMGGWGSCGVRVVWQFRDRIQDAAGLAASREDKAEMNGCDTEAACHIRVLPSFVSEGIPRGLDSGWAFRG